MRRAPPNTHLKTLLHSYGHRLTLPPTRDATGAWVYPEFLVAEAQGKLGVGVFATPAGGVEPGVWKSEPTVNLTGVNLTGSAVKLTALALPTRSAPHRLSRLLRATVHLTCGAQCRLRLEGGSFQAELSCNLPHHRATDPPIRREGQCSQVDCVQSTHRRVDCKSVKSTALRQSSRRS